MILYVQIALALMVLASCGYLVFAWIMACQFSAMERRYGKREGSGPVDSRSWPGVTQIKPVHVSDERSLELWRSFIDQDYPGPHEVIFAMGSRRSSAFPLVRSLIADYSENGSRVPLKLSVGTGTGYNRKIAACIPAIKLVTHDYVVLSDADMMAESDTLRRVIQPFSDPEVGVVTSLYIVRHADGVGAGLEGLSVLDFCASVLVARKYEGLSYAFGAVMAARSQVLQDIGGLEALGNYLGDDYQLGNKAVAKGWKVALVDGLVTDVIGKESFWGYFTHQLRWMRTYRVSRPGGFAAFLVTQGLLWSLLLLVASSFAWWGWSVLGAWCLYRTAWTVGMWRRLSHSAPASLWGLLVCAKDLVYLVLWCLALVGNTVEWGGTRFRVSRDGTMRLVEK